MKKDLTKALLEYRAEIIQKSIPFFVVEVLFEDTKHRKRFDDYQTALSYFTLFAVLPCSVLLRRSGSILNEDTILKKEMTNADYSRAV